MKTAHRPGHAIALHAVSKTYPTASAVVYALREVSLQVAPGEFVAVVGKSGSGKSTLLNLVAGLDRPSEGKLEVGGAPLHTMGEEQLARWRRHGVGVVFQFFQLLPTLSVLENVVLALELAGRVPRAERAERARRALDDVGILEQADKLPHTLSGGQQQRAAIARAMANDPPLLVADEPTGNLDSQSGAAVVKTFRSLGARGTTLVIVTHDEEFARLADRLVRISDGAIVEDRRRGAP